MMHTMIVGGTGGEAETRGRAQFVMQAAGEKWHQQQVVIRLPSREGSIQKATPSALDNRFPHFVSIMIVIADIWGIIMPDI